MFLRFPSQLRHPRPLRVSKTSKPAPLTTPPGFDTQVYKAFISYSHAVDGRLAPALQDALQRFTKPWYRRRALRVFRDEANLAANPALWSSIQTALDTSEFFILLASPEAARLPWVEREVKYWLTNKDETNFLIALTSGNIAWDATGADFDWNKTNALPTSLRKLFKEEPRYIDFRWARTTDHVTLGYPEFRNRVADLASPLYGRSKDDLVGEDIRAHRRTRAIVRSVIAVLTTLLLAVGSLVLLFFGQRNAARIQRDLAQQAARTAESRALAAEAKLSLGRQPALALLQSLQALQQSDTIEAEGSLLTALQYDPRNTSFLPVKGGASSVAFSPDGQLLASGAENNTIDLWDRQHRQPLGEPLRGHGKAVTSIAFSADGKLLASGSNDKSAILWDIQRHRTVGTPLVGHTDVVTSVAFSPDRRVLASGSDDGTIRLWDITDHKQLGKPLMNGTFVVKSLAFEPDGRTLAAGGTNAVVLWDIRGRFPARKLVVDGGMVHGVAFSPDGQTLAAGLDDGTIALWHKGRHEQLGKPFRSGQGSAPRPSETAVTSVAFSPDGDPLAAAHEGVITLWSVQHRQPTAKPLIGHSDVVTGVAFSPDGRTLASASEDQTVILWDVKHDPSLGQPLHNRIGPVTEVAVASDGRSLAAGGGDGTVTLWDIAHRRKLERLPAGDSHFTNGLAFSPDARLLAWGDGLKVRLWDVTLHEPSGQPFTDLGDLVTSVAFSPDGRLLISGSQAGTIHVWDVRSREAVGQPLESGAGGVASLAFSPNGKAIVAGTDTG